MFAIHSAPKHDLLKMIDQKRKEMIMIAKSYGLSSQNTLQCSQELDGLIIQYQQVQKGSKS